MKIFKGILILVTMWLSACGDQVEIQVLPFETKPVVYCVIDPNDTVHSIRIERVFSGFAPPAITASNPDSLLFKEVKVTVSLIPFPGVEACTLEAKRVEVTDKEPGYFGYQRHLLYQFEKIVKYNSRNLFTRLGVKVEIPGLVPATAETRIINTPVIWSPMSGQQFIYIVPDSPLRIQWSGGSWNEVDIRFEIKEEYADSIATRVLQFQKNNDVQINGKYYEIRIPYELVVQGIAKNFQYRTDIIRRYFGPVTFTIHTGQNDYANYIEYLGGINDFNQNPFSNIENGIGLLTSKSSIKKGPMLLDQTSRIEFATDPLLEKLNFIEY